MKYKAIIGQIIKEEEYKKFGFIKYPNCDYLNLVEKEYFEECKKSRYKYNGYILFGGLIVAGLLAIANWAFGFPDIAAPALLVWLILGVIIVVWNVPRNDKYLWDSPFPVEKPHDYKVNDEVEINVEIKLWQK